MSVLKIKDKDGNWVGIQTIKGDKGDPGDTNPHAERHTYWGEDPITPESIGAATSGEVSEALINASKANALAGDALQEARAAQSTADAAQAAANSKAPAYTYGTDDVEAGSASPHATGTLHFVYE